MYKKLINFFLGFYRWLRDEGIAFYNPGMDEFNTEKNMTIINNIVDFDNKITEIASDKDRYIKLSDSAIKSASEFTTQNFYFSMMDKI